MNDYSVYYSNSGLWDKLASCVERLGSGITWYVLVLYYTLCSREVSLKNKAIILGALGYLICPVDAVPDFIPVLGYADDIDAIRRAFNAVSASVTPAIRRRADAKLRQWFR